MTDKQPEEGLAARVVTIDPLPTHIQHISEPKVLPITKAILGNLGTEISNWDKVPCSQYALYSGMLASGLVGGWRIWRTKSIKGLHAGFLAGMLTAFFSWHYCRLQMNSSTHVGLRAAQMAQAQREMATGAVQDQKKSD